MQQNEIPEDRARMGETGGPAASAARVRGANARVNVALVGCGLRGIPVAQSIQEVNGVEYVAACDVYDPQAAAARAALGGRADTCRDFRRVLERSDVDAVHIASPDHWHAIQAVMALDAGKHVYVEKPLGHNVRDGQAMVEASRAHPELVFLTGTQHRSAPTVARAAEMVRSGQIRDVHYVKVWNHYNAMPAGIGAAPDSEPPPDADWDLYLGPAPWVPFNKKRFGPSYRHFTDYAGGWITDFGVHRFDSVHQIMGVETPTSVIATGGRFAVGGACEHPDVLQVTCEYPGFIMCYETLNTNGFGAMGRLTPGITHHSTNAGEDRPNGMAFYGSNATMVVDRRAIEIIPEVIPEERQIGILPEPLPGPKLERVAEDAEEPSALHGQHFIRCIRDGEKPLCDALVGHRGTNVAHLANISYRVGRRIYWDAEKEIVQDDPEAAALLGREARPPWDMI